MTKWEKELLENFDKLYMTEINGYIWNDCCDYEDGLPTWFYFTNDKWHICGYYDMNCYEIYRNYKYGCSDTPIKTFKTLKGAMNYGKNNL